MSASAHNRPSGALIELQSSVENTLMQLMSVIRKGDDAATQNILKQWLTMYHSIYKVTTEEDVPYDMYVMMIENVVQVLVVHVLSSILKEGCGKGLLSPTHHHGLVPPSERNKESQNSSSKRNSQERNADNTAVRESLRRAQRGESEEEVLLLVDTMLTGSPRSEVVAEERARTTSYSGGKDDEITFPPEEFMSSITRELENTAIVRWSKEYHHFRVFRKYTGSIFHYLNQYVTPGCGLEDVEVMCNKLFYSVVFEPTRGLQLQELTKNMELVLKEMIQRLVDVVITGDEMDDDERALAMQRGTSTLYEKMGSSVSFLQESQEILQQNPLVERVWRRARAVLPVLRLDVRFLAVQRVLDSWSVFLDEVSGGTANPAPGSTPIAIVPTGDTPVASTPTPPPPLPEGIVKNTGGVRRIVLPSQTREERERRNGASPSLPSPGVDINFRELERLQAFLALPPTQRRATPLPTISQDAYEATMRQLVATICEMLTHFKTEVDSQLERITLTHSKNLTTVFLEEENHNEAYESWKHVLVRTLLWETAIRLVGPLWAHPDVSRTLSAVLSPPLTVGSSIIINPQFSFQILVKMWLTEKRKYGQSCVSNEELLQVGATCRSSVSCVSKLNTHAEGKQNKQLQNQPVLSTLVQDIEDGIHTISCMMKFSSSSRGMLSQATMVLSEMITSDISQTLLEYHLANGQANKRTGHSFLLDSTFTSSTAGATEETRGVKLINTLSDIYALYHELNNRCLDGRVGIQNALEQAVRDVLTKKNQPLAQRIHTAVSLPVREPPKQSHSPILDPGSVPIRNPAEEEVREHQGYSVLRCLSTRVFSMDATQVTDVLTPTHAAPTGPDELSPRPGSAEGSTIVPISQHRGISASPNPDFPTQSFLMATEGGQRPNGSSFRPIDLAKLLVDYFFHYALIEDQQLFNSKRSDDSNQGEREEHKKKSVQELERHYASLSMWITVLQNGEEFSKYFKKRLLQRLLAPPSISCSSQLSSVSVREESKRLLKKLVAAAVPVPRRTLVSWVTLIHFLQPCVTKGEPLVLSSSASPLSSRFPSMNGRPSPPLLSVHLYSRRHWPLPALLWSSHGGGPRGSSVGAGGGSGSGGRAAVGSSGGGVLPGLTMPLPVQHALNSLVGKLSVSYPLRRMEWVHWKGYVVFSGLFPGSTSEPSSFVTVRVTTANVLQGALLYWINETTLSVRATIQSMNCVANATSPPGAVNSSNGSLGQDVTGSDLAKKMGLSFVDIQSQLQVLLEAGATGMGPGNGLVVCTVSDSEGEGGIVHSTHNTLSVLAVEHGHYRLNENFCLNSRDVPSHNSPSGGMFLMLPGFPHDSRETGVGRSGISGGVSSHKTTRRHHGQSKTHTPERDKKEHLLSTSQGTGKTAPPGERFPWNDRLQAFIMSLLKKKSPSVRTPMTLSFSDVKREIRSRFGNYVEIPVMKAALERLIEVGYVKRCAEQQAESSVFPPSGGGQRYALVP